MMQRGTQTSKVKILTTMAEKKRMKGDAGRRDVEAKIKTTQEQDKW